ncbi:hypothetical protein [Mycobacteroides abscessus]|uniref:hypothetical protein n=1 Tax=Mycobacteroides abscessus TaxID=36809 RepID=UPI0013EF64EC|nr:hypothetical protein [Mycobacteroides abscessus]MDM2697630.1 hypothetical protein [Mycobacteroides abscessus]
MSSPVSEHLSHLRHHRHPEGEAIAVRVGGGARVLVPRGHDQVVEPSGRGVERAGHQVLALRRRGDVDGTTGGRGSTSPSFSHCSMSDAR